MSNAITKHGIQVKPGQIWRDLDRRTGDRHCRVEALTVDHKALMQPVTPTNFRAIGTRCTKVAVARMHKGSTGWELVKDVAERP